MKDRSVWAFLVFALLVLGAIYLLRKKPVAPPPAPAKVVTAPASNPVSTPPPAVAPVVVERSTPAAPAVTPPAAAAPTGLVVRAGRNGEATAIPDGKTIDMSSGRAVVRDDARSRAIIDRSVKEMEDAAKEVTFGPRPAPAEKKKAEEPAAKP